MHVLEVNNYGVVIDAGLVYADNESTGKESLVIPPEAARAKAIILTHAHSDHSGKIPLLLANGFTGSIYCTQATQTLTFEMFAQGYAFENVKFNFYCSQSAKERADLRQSALTVHFNNCGAEIKNPYYFKQNSTLAEITKERSFKPILCKKCLEGEIEKIKPLFKAVPLNKQINLSDNLSFYFFNAGHIPGAASVYFSAKGAVKKYNIVFSGDLGNFYSNIIVPPEAPKPADYIFMESTYSSSPKQTFTLDDYKEFNNYVSENIKNNSVVWISAFTLNRTQKVLYQIRRMQQLGIINKTVKVFAPSPSANKFTKLYLNEIKRSSTQPWFKKDVYANGLLPYDYSTKMPKNFEGPVIIVSSDSSMARGRSAAILPRVIENHKTAIAFVGYLPPQSPAGLIFAGNKKITFNGKTFKVNAKFKKFDIFSDHTDSAGALKWLANQNKNVNLYLMHGELATIQKNVTLLKNLGFQNARAAIKGAALIIEK